MQPDRFEIHRRLACMRVVPAGTPRGRCLDTWDRVVHDAFLVTRASREGSLPIEYKENSKVLIREIEKITCTL